MASHNGRSRLSFRTIKRFLLGNPKDVHDTSIFHRLALIPFLAWIGLGSDGLSSSAYGPEEAFKILGEHTYLALLLVIATGFTVLIISAAYSKIIEAFPHGGGGYVVASKLLGHKVGVISGCALLVDYVLTITTSIAAAGDAIFSFLPPHWHHAKLAVEAVFVLILIILNLRGVKESVIFLTPIFLVFLATHLLAILGGILGHIPEMAHTAASVHQGFVTGSQSLGWGAMLLLFVHAYSMGGGTYTGIEAVSNGLPIMREPRVPTAKRTMLYMAVSLSFTASGLLLCYLLWQVHPVEGKTLNAVLFEKLANAASIGNWLVVLALFSEGLLLVVAAQAGFIDGPRVLANMAVDSWVPRRFAALSDRLTTANGVILMGVSSLLALIYTRGNVGALLVMYSINVFLTFSLSNFGMLRHSWEAIGKERGAKRNLALFAVGFVLCALILCITVAEKLLEGGWITLAVTGGLVLLCFTVKGHYLQVAKELRHLDVDFSDLLPKGPKAELKLNHAERSAVVLVGGYGGLGQHTVASILRTFPGVYRNFIFISVGVLDSGAFKGEGSVETLTAETAASLQKYVDLSHRLGIPATYRMAVGTEVVQEAFRICQNVAAEFPQCTIFAGKVIFKTDELSQRLLHNETAYSVQKNVQRAGLTMVILPAKLG